MVKLYLGGFPKSFERAIGDVCLEYGFSTVKSEANADLRVLVDPKKLSELDLWRDVFVLAEPEVVFIVFSCLLILVVKLSMQQKCIF